MSEAAPTNTPPPIGEQLRYIGRDIKLSHTVFALPFALLATFLAADWGRRLPGWDEFVLILLCMFFARTSAMTVNRWLDASFDTSNPRTSGRAVPSGRVPARTMGLTAIGSALLLVVGAGGFWVFRDNPWPLLLSPVVLAVLCGYSLTKRFTWLCHAVLGLALALSPLAATIAIEPGYLGSPVVWLLGLMVLCWVAGFDVIYALQDVEHDRAEGLHSMPSRLGVGRAMWISRASHLVAAGCLVGMVMTSEQLGVVFAAGVALTIGLLLLEHALVWGSRTHQLNTAFFTVNGVISLLLGAGGLADILLAS
ncbi:MAG: UbiA-like polyprenyltransferase [Planctomycetota bacterium]